MAWFVSRWKKCKPCNGTGTVENEDGEEVTCEACNGRGKTLGTSMM